MLTDSQGWKMAPNWKMEHVGIRKRSPFVKTDKNATALALGPAMPPPPTALAEPTVVVALYAC